MFVYECTSQLTRFVNIFLLIIVKKSLNFHDSFIILFALYLFLISQVFYNYNKKS